jgi:hypothetical protein
MNGQSAFEIPDKVVISLDSSYPGWHLVDNLEFMTILERSNIDTTKCRPNFVKGDFNGDGERDYIVFVERNSNSKYREQFLVLFLGKDSDFKEQLLDSAANDAYITQFIWLCEKGSKSYNFDNDKEFVLQYDAIELVVWEKASELIYYDNGKFRRITTSD